MNGRWAMTLLETVVQRLHREYESTGRGALFLELRFTIAMEGHAKRRIPRLPHVSG